MASLDKISNNILKKAGNKEEVRMSSLWEEKPCVIFFMRRFGWMFCRLGAKELNAIYPQLVDANVNLIGIGLEELGVEEFIKGNYFDGDLYVDSDKKSFTALSYRKHSYLSIIPTLISKVARSALGRAKTMGVDGNMKGDGFQMGGLVVVAAKGEKILFEFRQENPADHATNHDILQSLGLQTEGYIVGATSKETVDCEDACALPPK